MTDKDIKDYCKNCDVEPPAIRFKCPECEHNTDNENIFAKDINVPSKEQIMIDGVDVSGCRYGEIEKDVFKCSCEYNVRSASMFCKDNPNCHYKLYKRKEQEYEELRQYHNKCCEEFEKEKQNLIDRYNQFSKDFFIGKYCKKEYCDLLKAKEQECEELKREIDLYKTWYRAKHDDIRNLLGSYRKECEELKKIKSTLKKALDEIAEHCEKVIKNLTTYDDVYDANISIEALHNISDIINKAKGK